MNWAGEKLRKILEYEKQLRMTTLFERQDNEGLSKALC